MRRIVTSMELSKSPAWCSRIGRLLGLLGLVTVPIVSVADASYAEALRPWRLDPKYTICTSKAAWARDGTVPLCAGKRMIFHTPAGEDGLIVPEIRGFRQFGNGRSGILDFRISSYGTDDSYKRNRIRFRTSDGGRHWRPLRNIRVERGSDGEEIKFKVATGPCTWRNFTHKEPRQLGGFGNTCFPFGLLGDYSGGAKLRWLATIDR